MTVMPGTTTSDRLSHHSPASESAVSVPTWAPPRAPLPPHRLAKLANALGVSTPLPAVHPYFSSLSTSPPVPNSSASSTFPDHFRRSPTPSAASIQTFTSSSSSTKFLLHVIPPSHLPHDSDVNDELAPLPAASGYHTQFQRGVLVPVYPTLSTQLAAIAKEYALPSTLGMILYLVISNPGASLNAGRSLNGDVTEAEEPGPRVSEDIWRHIWYRVVKSEKDETLVAPRPIGLGIAGAQSSPSLLQDMSNSLRPLISPNRVETPQPQLTPSPSTASHSVFSQTELDTPESISSVSGGLDARAEDLHLPGLHSPALIPILAKVEFDIDRRKAAWYEPWLRSRRVNHAKRAESRMGTRMRRGSKADSEEEPSEDETRKAPIDLKLVGRMRSGSSAPSFLQSSDAEPADIETGYSQLSESPEDADFDGVSDQDPTTRLNLAPNGDPLADVFGTDGETWADLHSESQSGRSKRQENPNVVELALDAAALADLPDKLEEDEMQDNDEEEVRQLWKKQNRPSLVVSIPSPPAGGKRRSSPTTAGTITARRPPPPPLNLAPSLLGSELGIEVSPATASNSDSTRLPYLQSMTPPSSEDTVSTRLAGPANGVNDSSDRDSIYSLSEESEVGGRRRIRSPEDEKREGAIFEDLDLGLADEPVEFDESDPHDRRRSQLMLKAQLDEIERNLVQFSPRRLKTEELDESSPPRRSRSGSTLIPSPWESSPRLNGALSGSPRRSNPTLSEEGASWPAIPFSALNGKEAPAQPQADSESRPPSPPRIAFNGISTEPPKSPFARRARSGTISDETLARKRELEEDALYPPLVPPTGLLRERSHDSPIIPLSPDPFGRFPSEAESTRLAEERQSKVYQNQRPSLPNRNSINRLPPVRKASLGVIALDQPDLQEDRPPSKTPSSRFSLDSVTSDEGAKNAKTASVISMKNIKKLWRKTNSKLSLSGSAAPPSASGRSSPHLMPNGQELPSGRPMSRTISKSPQFENGSIDYTEPAARVKRRSSVRNMYLDQDSRYPVIPSRTPPLDASRQPSPALPPLPPSATPSPNMSPQPPPAAPERNSNVRKSILKSWKSASGSLSAQSASSASTPRSSSELLQDAPMKRRRPSVLDTASVRRGSMTSTSTTLVDIPPTPTLPDQYAYAQARSKMSQSQFLGDGAPKRGSMRQRPSPSISSVSSTSSPPRAQARLIPAPSPPRGSGESFESRPSFDASQFEIVSPKLDAHRLENTLSYPYTTLDHSMTTAE
ncbi:hypothetical protein AcW1_001198 [Taiwanofungus camphoratus]|nr:hypothetical protein AcW1_001198 [Antrodia cinnamomea]